MAVLHSKEHVSESRASIPRMEWPEFLRFFTRRHQGAPVWIESRDALSGKAVSLDNLPLIDASLDSADPAAPKIEITVKAKTRDIRFTALNPHRMMFSTRQDDHDEALIVESPGSSIKIGRAHV